jgi:hypothetical protein
MQLAALPVSVSMVQAVPSLHIAAVGQEAIGSHVSLASITPLSQVVVQSLSVLALQPGGQQPSPLVHCVMT